MPLNHLFPFSRRQSHKVGGAQAVLNIDGKTEEQIKARNLASVKNLTCCEYFFFLIKKVGTDVKDTGGLILLLTFVVLGGDMNSEAIILAAVSTVFAGFFCQHHGC
jgi:hypothetical protein